MKCFLGLGLTVFLLGACSYSKHESPRANGAEKVLYFDRVANADLGIVPLRHVRKIRVHYMPGGEYECSIGVTNASPRGGVSLQSGGSGHLPDIPEHCENAPGEEAIVLDSAQCEDGACDVVSKTEGSSIALEVSGTAARATRLRVTVRTRDGAPHSDVVSLEFAPADHIALAGSRMHVPALAVPITPGIRLGRMTPTVVDAKGRTMSIEPDSIQKTVQGDVLGSDETVATNVGKGAIQWELPGIVSRTVGIEVVDPIEARAVIVLRSAPRDESELVDFDAWRATPGAEEPLTAIDLVARDPGWSFHPTRLVLADGRRALGVLGSVTASAPRAVSIVKDDWAFALTALSEPAELTLSVTAFPSASVMTELPVRIRK